ncbi:MAG: hypothetical protein OXJ53_08625 [Gammaproteobacteria bacterium]|nr:hypothetical protein [Gammaproteobacteria bacterium]
MRAALMQRGRIWVDDLEMPEPVPGELLLNPAQADPFKQPDIRAVKDLVVFEWGLIKNG